MSKIKTFANETTLIILHIYSQGIYIKKGKGVYIL